MDSLGGSEPTEPAESAAPVPVRLVLEDGSEWQGRLATGGLPGGGRELRVVGEVVFNTSMTGYQELVSDPSYAGQIVVLTYPQVGNYGVREGEDESDRPLASALITRELYDARAVGRDAFGPRLAAAGVPVAEGFDTRALTRHLRRRGTLRGVLTADRTTPAGELATLASTWRSPSALEVGTRSAYRVEPARSGGGPAGAGANGMAGMVRALGGRRQEPARHAVVVDLGVKRNIVRALAAAGCRVTVVPATTPAADIRALAPDVVILSNGPGDPRDLAVLLGEVRRVAESLPTFGICLGHQLLGLAFGARAYKLPYGHRGANHPVKDLITGRVAITSQNHGYALDGESVEQAGLVVSHVNLNDGTVEGLVHPHLPVWGLQFHPEAAPGPRDAADLLAGFLAATGGAVASQARGEPGGGAGTRAVRAVSVAAGVSGVREEGMPRA
ncbi:MAG: carbamoyl phosphate synthase small subunit [Bacillota bacterium]|nr:MAG: carbamoyl phosphate synthase small subunit [Bacillota bacterium]